MAASPTTRKIGAAVRALSSPVRAEAQANWMASLARLVSDKRPDLRDQLCGYVEELGADPSSSTPLDNMSIGELGVVYEALMALSDHGARRSSGQYFTPDDVAEFMARQSESFPSGTWVDPCCGVGNLSWYLAKSQADPAAFVRDQLSLVDRDKVALTSAVVLLTAAFAPEGDRKVLPALARRAFHRDFLAPEPLPPADFALVNPPYGRTELMEGYATAAAQEAYAYFLERIVGEYRGCIAITPASYLVGMRYRQLRQILLDVPGGEIFVFDNVPDTVFRGLKYGSLNTSSTNFVRAAITVIPPDAKRWCTTPIMRWTRSNREKMWETLVDYLVPLRLTPQGQWAKVMPGTEGVWKHLEGHPPMGSTVLKRATPYPLWVASTPRYYLSASKRRLDRASVHVFYFANEDDQNQAYLLLNSSLAYWWWRCLDGGITLQKRTLLSLPIPPAIKVLNGEDRELVRRLEEGDLNDLTFKLNAGRANENVRRPPAMMEKLDQRLLPGITVDFTPVFASDMFA